MVSPNRPKPADFGIRENGDTRVVAGVVYEAKSAPGCDGCAFLGILEPCKFGPATSAVETFCGAGTRLRYDAHTPGSVIWVLAETKIDHPEAGTW